MVELLKTGLFDTIQDLGRFGVQNYGVPFSGAMDLFSAQNANAILGNSYSDAVMEITIIGPKLKFHCNTEIALTGADLSPKLNSEAISMDSSHRVKKGDVLSFGQRRYGCRVYMAVSGGFQTELVMNSRSMYSMLTKQARLNKGDLVPIMDAKAKSKVKVDEKIIQTKVHSSHFKVNEIMVHRGMEFNVLSESEKQKLFTTEFTVSKDSNRMAYQVNERIDNKLESIITSIVLPGTIQLTPSGRLLILMRDCQVTGGYSRILQVSEQSINHLSQKIFGDKFRFKCID